MNVDFNVEEIAGYHDLIIEAIADLRPETVGTEAYQAKLDHLKELQELKNSTDEVMIDDKKVEDMKPKWFDRAIKIAGVCAPFAVTGLMIWWDRRDEGGHIMSQYINPALRAGDGAK